MYEAPPLSLDAVLEKYQQTVQRIAYSMCSSMPANVEVCDMIQAGLIGLMDAQKTFKPSLSVPFEAYLVKKVRWAIVDELRRQDWLPKSMRTKRKALDEATKRASVGKGRARDEEIAKEMDMDLTEYRKMLTEVDNAQIVYYEDFDNDEDAGNSFLEKFAITDESTPETIVQSMQMRQQVIAAYTNLPEREALVLSLYYEQELTYKEIAEILDISTPRVHQIHAQAISRLRNSILG